MESKRKVAGTHQPKAEPLPTAAPSLETHLQFPPSLDLRLWQWPGALWAPPCIHSPQPIMTKMQNRTHPPPNPILILILILTCPGVRMKEAGTEGIQKQHLLRSHEQGLKDAIHVACVAQID